MEIEDTGEEDVNFREDFLDPETGDGDPFLEYSGTVKILSEVSAAVRDDTDFGEAVDV